jgi:hypothetical protein
MKNFENVNGTVIGGYSCKVCLIDPSGCIVNYKIVSNDVDFVNIADNMKEQALAEKLGNGQLLRDRPDLIQSLHGTGDWTLKIIDIK